MHTPGSGYVLLHHVMGETNGSRGIWSCVPLPLPDVSFGKAHTALIVKLWTRGTRSGSSKVIKKQLSCALPKPFHYFD